MPSAVCLLEALPPLCCSPLHSAPKGACPRRSTDTMGDSISVSVLSASSSSPRQQPPTSSSPSTSSSNNAPLATTTTTTADTTTTAGSEEVPRVTAAPLIEQHPASSRSSKRANSTVSMSERNKFRSRLDAYSYDTSLPSSSPPTSERNYKEFTTTKDEQHTAASSADPRHYSASSILNPDHHNDDDDKSFISPLAPSLDYFWSNKSLDRLFPIKLIDNNQLKSIMNWHYSNPLPECEAIFPWLHGIHHSNQNQRDFLNSLMNFTTIEKNNFDAFNTKNKIPSTSRCLMPVRSNCIQNKHERVVKNSGVLKGSVMPEEILCPLDVSKQDLLILLNSFLKDLKIHETNEDDFENVLRILFQHCELMGLLPIFKNLDPVKGISLRNFHIQVSKLSQISDFIVYCFNDSHLDSSDFEHISCHCASVARLLYFAQLKHAIDYPELIGSMFTTLILQDNDLSFFRRTESNQSLLAIDKIDDKDTKKPIGKFCSLYDFESFNNWDTNYLFREKLEISRMSTATHVMKNVWFGNTTDFEVLKLKGPKPFERLNGDSTLPLYVDPSFSTVTVTRDRLLNDKDDEALITPAMANWKLFVNCCEGSNFPNLKLLRFLLASKSEDLINQQTHLTFPPSGSIGIGDCTDDDLISLINTCKLLYTRSSQDTPSLIYCSDGYTESSLLGVCFAIYASGEPLTKVIVDLHTLHGRPFFLFPTDVQLISRLEELLLHYSPVHSRKFEPKTLETIGKQLIYKQLYINGIPTWCTRLNGSLPSRILGHLYLGSLHHASCPELLENLGITRIVSVGEKLNWENEDELHRTIINSNISVINGIPNTPIEKVMCVSNIQDDGIDTLTHNLKDILEFIDEAYQSNGKILVHCRVGVSRSATVCIAEVMKRLKINLIRAYIYVRVRRLNVIIQPNLRFMYELVKWEESERLINSKKKLLEAKSSITNSPVDSVIPKHPISGVELSKKLSSSISSLSSAVSDSVITESTTIPFLESANSPIRIASTALDQVIEDDDDGADNGSVDEDYDDSENNYWLRDVDWHILCREIDLLNKTYIGVK